MKLVCNACGSNSLRIKYSNVSDYEYETYKSVDYIRCDSCGLLTQHPLPGVSKIPSFYPKQYRNHLNIQKSGFYVRLKSLQVMGLARSLEKYIPSKESNILEIGCGGGALLLALKSIGYKNMCGTDMSRASKLVLEKHGIRFIEANIDQSFPYREQFDVIILNQVIEHVLQPTKLIRTCSSHLKNSGVLLLMTPNADSWTFSIFGKFTDGLNAPRHTYVFTSRSFDRIKQRLKFDSAQSIPMADPMQWAISMQNALQQVSLFRVRLHHGLAWYVLPLGLMCTPVALLSTICHKSAGILCVMRK